MSAEETVITDDVAAKARELGWRPKDEFRGKPEGWVDAQEYLDRGKQVMPILKANNLKLETELAAAKAQLQEQASLIQASQESIEELKKFNSAQARAAAEQLREQIKAELKQARRDGDVDREVELQDQLADQTAALKKAEETPSSPAKAPDPNVAKARQEFDQWAAEKAEWYNKDPVKTALANGVAVQLRNEGSKLEGRAFYDEVAKRVSGIMDKRADVPSPDKVSGGGRSGSPSSNGGGQSWGDLPSDVRSTAEKFLEKGHITVGPGRAFKTKEEYRTHYAKTYFAKE